MALNPAQLAQYQAMLAAQQPPTPHLQFKAGLCAQSGRTVTADKRRGTVRLITTDGLLHLQWLTRPGDVLELDLMLFRDSAVWEKVNSCTDGRVYLLRFRDSSSRTFFWMQEPAADKDAEIAAKISKLISSPPVEGPAAGAATGTAVNANSTAQQPSTPTRQPEAQPALISHGD